MDEACYSVPDDLVLSVRHAQIRERIGVLALEGRLGELGSGLLDGFWLPRSLGFHSEVSHEPHEQVCLGELCWLGRLLSGETGLLLVDPDRVPLLLFGVVIFYCSMSFGRHTL